MLLDLAPGWTMDLDRGPDWLFVRLRQPKHPTTLEVELAEPVWDALEQAFSYRLVLELEELQLMRSWTIGELVKLHKRITAHGGTMRLSGLSDANQSVLRMCRLDGCFPQYRDRHDAVMGHRPGQPR